MLEEFKRLSNWLTTGFSYLYGTYVNEICHPPGLPPDAVLNSMYPGQIEPEILPVSFDEIESSVIYMFQFAVQKSIPSLGAPEEIAARQEAVILELKAAYENAISVYEFEFERHPAFEWQCAYLFLGSDRSLVIHFNCVWQ